MKIVDCSLVAVDKYVLFDSVPLFPRPLQSLARPWKKQNSISDCYLSIMETGDENLISTKVEVSTSFSSTAGSGSVEWSQEEEKALVRKFDWRMLPGLSILYLLCFLDRT